MKWWRRLVCWWKGHWPVMSYFSAVPLGLMPGKSITTKSCSRCGFEFWRREKELSPLFKHGQRNPWDVFRTCLHGVLLISVCTWCEQEEKAGPTPRANG